MELVVAVLQFDLRKPSRSKEHVQHVLQPWNREAIFAGSNIHAHSRAFIFLGVGETGTAQGLVFTNSLSSTTCPWSISHALEALEAAQ